SNPSSAAKETTHPPGGLFLLLGVYDSNPHTHSITSRSDETRSVSGIRIRLPLPKASSLVTRLFH
ncbi:MAG: hypothetical protein IJH52_08470, partial [Oscillospiraceae bacterium]|nr:hypothetical protein [Oscillospiraceae bacterium]